MPDGVNQHSLDRLIEESLQENGMPSEILLASSSNSLPEQYGFESKWFDLPGLRLHAAVAGPADGPLALLLHGFPEFWFSWRKQIPALAEAGYRVIAPDQRGYNLSDKRPPYDIFTLVQDAANLVAACGRPDAFVVGHDWGAMIAWSLAILRPERVKKLAILNVPHPALVAGGLGSAGLKQALKSWYVYFFQLPYLPEAALRGRNYAGMRRSMRSSATPTTFTSRELDCYRDAWAQPGALSASIGWYRALGRLMLSPRRRALVQRVSAPTLIQWGEQDVALEVSLAVKSVDWCDRCELVRYPQATHWVHEELPVEVNRRLLAFLASNAVNFASLL
jgi:pimeloyl-ACP methyl ester carboxylesterase